MLYKKVETVMFRDKIDKSPQAFAGCSGTRMMAIFDFLEAKTTTTKRCTYFLKRNTHWSSIMPICILCGINSRDYPKRSYHQIPKKQSRRDEWMAIISDVSTEWNENSRVCGFHFKPEHISKKNGHVFLIIEIVHLD